MQIFVKDVNNMKQTGLILKFLETDYMLGSSPLSASKVMPSKDWRPYLPKEEKQSEIGFDTMSCTSFSATSTIETWLNYYIREKKVPQTHLDFLEKEGYLDADYQVNFSDRFLAIMSGTTTQGNYFQKVLDTARNIGLIPERDLPFSGKNWDEYHDKTKITEAMKAKAIRFTELFSISYEWATLEVNDNIGEDLEYCPLQGAIPFPSYHAIVLPTPNYIFDTYKPFLYERQVPVHYSMRVYLGFKQPTTTYKYFKASEIKGLKPELVKLLDEARGYAGVPFIITSGYRTLAHNEDVGGVTDSSHTRGLAVDLLIKDGMSGEKINAALHRVGIDRFGYYKDGHIHCDIDLSKPNPCYWVK